MGRPLAGTLASAGFTVSGWNRSPLTPEVAEEAVRLRKEHHLKLPDAIIYATARAHGCLLVTRNTKDFSAREPGRDVLPQPPRASAARFSMGISSPTAPLDPGAAALGTRFYRASILP